MLLDVAPEVEELARRRPAELRAMIRRGEWAQGTFGLAVGYTQVTLAILPREYAFEYLLFCQRNPKPCPVLEVTDPGSPEPRRLAPGADLRTDLPKYRVFEQGRLVAEPTDIRAYWRDDLVAFLMGCALTWVGALARANVPVPKVSIYVTSVPCVPAGRFSGPLVVSMRPLPADKVVRAVQVTSRFPHAHGAPVHLGDPAALGIPDLAAPYYGEPRRPEPGQVPVFWACGVTAEAVALASKVPFMITHSPGHMFITDQRDEEGAAL